eukprot:SAG22_NODE_179_length_16124_cov_7.355445_9_plen_1322_part_00
MNGLDLYGASSYYGWPLWQTVQTAVVNEKGKHLDNHFAGQRGRAVNWCQSMSFMFQLAWFASFSFYFMISVDLFLNLVTSPFEEKKGRWVYYYVFPWCLAFFMSVALMYSGDWGVSEDSILEDFCWNVNFGVPSGGKSKYPEIQEIAYYTNAAFWVVAWAVLIFTFVEMREGKLTKGQKRARGQAIKMGRDLTFLCTLWWTVIFLFYYFVALPYQEHTLKPAGRLPYEQCPPGRSDLCYKNESGPLGIRMGDGPIDYMWREWDDEAKEGMLRTDKMHKFVVTLFGLIVGGKSLINWLVWYRVIRRRAEQRWRPAEDGGGEGGAEGGEGDAGPASEWEGLPDVLRQELLFFSGLGIRQAVRDSHENPANATMNDAYFTAQAGGAEDEDEDEEASPVCSCWKTSPKEMASRQQLALARRGESVNLGSAEQFERDRTTAFWASFINEHFNVGGRPRDTHSLHELHRQLQQFRFKTYCPEKFQYLRDLFKIDYEPEGRGQGTVSLLHQAMLSHEVTNFTGGESGAFMYFSGDRRFIVKQITEAEHKVLLGFLDDYVNHMKSCRDERTGEVESLLLRIVQCNRLQMYQATGGLGRCLRGYLYFVVFENVFYKQLDEEAQAIMQEEKARAAAETEAAAATSEDYVDGAAEPQPEEAATAALAEDEAAAQERYDSAWKKAANVLIKYDLKGSWVNRSTNSHDTQARSGDTRLDNDLKEELYLSEAAREKMMEMLDRDSAFLEKHDVMDYSALLGIQMQLANMTHNAAADGQLAGQSMVGLCHPSHAKGPRTYQIGITDIFQEWNMSRRAEWYFKALLGRDFYGISACPPEFFRKRFLASMGEHFSVIDTKHSHDRHGHLYGPVDRGLKTTRLSVTTAARNSRSPTAVNMVQETGVEGTATLSPSTTSSEHDEIQKALSAGNLIRVQQLVNEQLEQKGHAEPKEPHKEEAFVGRNTQAALHRAAESDDVLAPLTSEERRNRREAAEANAALAEAQEAWDWIEPRDLLFGVLVVVLTFMVATVVLFKSSSLSKVPTDIGVLCLTATAAFSVAPLRPIVRWFTWKIDQLPELHLPLNQQKIGWFGTLLFLHGIVDLFVDAGFCLQMLYCDRVLGLCASISMLCTCCVSWYLGYSVVPALTEPTRRTNGEVDTSAQQWVFGHAPYIGMIVLMSGSRIESMAMLKLQLKWPIQIPAMPMQDKHLHFLRNSGMYHHLIEDLPHIMIAIVTLLYPGSRGCAEDAHIFSVKLPLNSQTWAIIQITLSGLSICLGIATRAVQFQVVEAVAATNQRDTPLGLIARVARPATIGDASRGSIQGETQSDHTAARRRLGAE